MLIYTGTREKLNVFPTASRSAAVLKVVTSCHVTTAISHLPIKPRSPVTALCDQTTAQKMTMFSSRLAQTRGNIPLAQIWKSGAVVCNVCDALACGGGLFPYCKRWVLPATYTQKLDTSRFHRQTTDIRQTRATSLLTYHPTKRSFSIFNDG